MATRATRKATHTPAGARPLLPRPECDCARALMIGMIVGIVLLTIINSAQDWAMHVPWGGEREGA